MYRGGMMAQKGFYWSPLTGRHVNMNDSGVLPGEGNSIYLKVSPLLLLAVAPFLGLMFVMFLPLLGVGVLLILCLLPIFSALSSTAMTGLRTISRVAGMNGSFRRRR
jgi:hypothetical protein